jgi:hypothetical protein
MLPSDRWLYKFRKKRAWVFVPAEDTIAYGREIKGLIEKHWKAPDYYCHLQKGGHVAALRGHNSHEYFLHLDIKNFFGNINASRITRCLKGMLSYEKAREIAIHSTVHHPRAERMSILPFGFIQSPIIASVCLSRSTLGRCLHNLSKQPNITVSVYMDDIILSSIELDALTDALGEIEQASSRPSLPLNKKKQEGPCRKVSAFNINLSQNNINVTPERLSEFLESYHSSLNENQKCGILNYVAAINPVQTGAFV